MTKFVPCIKKSLQVSVPSRNSVHQLTHPTHCSSMEVSESQVMGKGLPDAESTFPVAMDKVFELELLREKILDYAIHDRTKETQVGTARTCRLVNKTWLCSISRILRKCQEPLFWLKLHNDGQQDVNQLLSLFQQFFCVHGPIHSGNVIPSFSINTRYFSFVQGDNYVQSILHCLRHYGCGLVKLDLLFIRHQQVPPLNANTRFPILREFEVTFDEDYAQQDKVNFIRSVFEASKQLQSFKLNNPYWSPTPLDLAGLLLPSSLTSVVLECCANWDSVDILVRSHLPNLKVLSISKSRGGIPVPPRDGVFTSILQNVGKTLTHLDLVGIPRFVNMMAPLHAVKLPLMEKLQSLRLHDMYLEVDNEDSSQLEQLFPAVTQVTLTSQTSDMFRRWTERSVFDLVTSLTFSWDEKEATLQDLTDSFQVRQMEALFTAFPNLQRLDLSIRSMTVQDLPRVAVIWREKRKLQHLKIDVRNYHYTYNTKVWEALLIGIAEERVDRLRESPGLWEQEELQFTATPSIRNLTDLQTLHLSSYDDSGPLIPVISDLTFQFAFLKMPKLDTLHLSGCFQVTQETKGKYETGGLAIHLHSSGYFTMAAFLAFPNMVLLG